MAVASSSVTFRYVEPLFRPRSIALVGASEKGARGWSRAVVENIRHFGPDVAIFPINPARDSVWGERCYRSFASLPSSPDLAITIVPARTIPAVLREGVAAGLKAAIVYAAGFGESGDAEGIALADELRALCAGGLRICGPNGMGTISVREGLFLYPTTRVRALRPGHVALVMQSGGLYQYWLEQAAVRGLGFSYAVSSGNELDADTADYVNFLVEDESTKIICCLIEGVRRPEAFVEAAARALKAQKPILCVKIGSSAEAREAAKSHTGSLAGDDRIFDAVCERYGIVRCPSIDDMIESAAAFSSGRWPRGSRVAVLGFSGAARGLALDAGASEGVEFARFASSSAARLEPYLDPGTNLANPVDLGGSFVHDPQRYSTVAQIVAADPDVAVLAVQGQLPVADEPVDPRWFAEIAASTDKPVLAYSRTAQNVLEVGRAFQEQSGLWFVQGIPETIRVMRQLIDYGDRVAKPPAASPTRSRSARGTMNDLLDRFGIPRPAELLARSVDEAAGHAGRIGLPVALKLHSERPIHKTDVQGVALNLDDLGEVERAAQRLFEIARTHPELACDGVLVQEMVRGAEMLVGAKLDEDFGPVIVLGLGGVFVELVDEVALCLLPVEAGDVRRMLRETRAQALLEGARGLGRRDIDGLVEAAVAVGRLFLEHDPPLRELEINPLIVLDEGRGVRAVDVRAVPLEAP